MWPLSAIRDDQVIVSIEENHVFFAWVSFSKKKKLHLNAFASYACSLLAVATLGIQLKKFIARHALTHANMSISLSNPYILQDLVRLSKATASSNDFAFNQMKQFNWDYIYLHALDNGEHLFYVCGASAPMLLTSYLFAHYANTNLFQVTSNYMALLNAYIKVYGTAFRQSQLACDMIKSEYGLHQVIKNECITQLISIPAHLNIDISDHKIPLLVAIGLANYP